MIDAKELRIGNWVNRRFMRSAWTFNGPRPAPEEIVVPVEIDSIGLVDGRNGIDFSVDADGDVDYTPFKELEGIPLAPELLEKCGLEHYNNEKVDYVLFTSHGNDIGIKKCPGVDGYYLVGDRYRPVITHLHELQNLVFILSGTELEIQL